MTLQQAAPTFQTLSHVIRKDDTDTETKRLVAIPGAPLTKQVFTIAIVYGTLAKIDALLAQGCPCPSAAEMQPYVAERQTKLGQDVTSFTNVADRFNKNLDTKIQEAKQKIIDLETRSRYVIAQAATAV
jgi:hypothetical protein